MGAMPIYRRDLALLRAFDESIYEQARLKQELEERRERARELTTRRAWTLCRLAGALGASGPLVEAYIRTFFGLLHALLSHTLPVGLIVGAVWLRATLLEVEREEATR
jgi:hypothetical protein